MAGRIWILAGVAALASGITLGSVVEGFGSGAEKLNRADKRWLEKEVAALITLREASTFKNLADSQRERFKELFWARRDTNPRTPENEFLDIFHSRIRIADQYFKARGTRGSLTDMGQIFTLLGQPTRRAHGRSVSATSSELASGGGIQDSLQGSTSELMPPGQSEEPGGSASQASSEPPAAQGRFASWIYSPEVIGGGSDLELQFRAMPGFGYRLLRNDGLDEILDTLKASLITRPDIDYSVDESGNLLPVATTFVSTATSVLEDLLITHEPSTDIAFQVDSAHFKSTDGSTYVPLLFEVAPDSVTFVDGKARLTFFGAITDLDGVEFYRFEEPSSYEAGSAPLDFELPLQLPPGDYSVFLGVVDEQYRTGDDQAAPFYGSRATTMSVPDFSSPASQFSSIIVYDRARESTSIPGPGNAFQFGRMKLDPIGGRGFHRDDSLGLFYYVYGVAPSAKLTAQYVFFLAGDEVAQTAAEAMPTSSQHAVGAVEVPLADFAPGSYRLLVRVEDEATGQILEKWLRFTLEA